MSYIFLGGTLLENQKSYLARLLLKYREINHFTQQFVADKVGITRSTYTYYETGKTQPSIETLQALKKLLNIPSEEFFPPEKTRYMNYLSDSGAKRNFDYYFNPPQAPAAPPKTMGELNDDEKELIANYRLANNILKRKARNILDPEYETLKQKKTQD